MAQEQAKTPSAGAAAGGAGDNPFEIKGTPADGAVGPDLTHLASRTYFGAGFFQVNAGNLSAWVRDPRDLKPGVNMPSFSSLSDEELQDLVAYLLSLK